MSEYFADWIEVDLRENIVSDFSGDQGIV